MQLEKTKEVNNFLSTLINSLDLGERWSNISLFIVDLLILIVLIFIIDWLAKRIVLTTVKAFILKTEVKWDDVFLENKVFDYLAHFAPLASLDYIAHALFTDYYIFVNLIDIATDIGLIWLFVIILSKVIKSIVQLSQGSSKYVSLVIQSLAQLINIIIIVFAIIATFSTLLNIHLTSIFTALGTLTAVIILVFKDTILGFVASVQMSTSKMLKLGDWVSMPSYGADGPLVQLDLTKAKIQNWDKTITSVPTYALISSGVKNWEGMTNSGVRRIKRSINFDVNSIRFCTSEDIETFKKYDLLAGFIENKEVEIGEYNSKVINKEFTINGRKQTNIGVYRKYTEQYLTTHENISTEETLMVRQLQSTESGLPLEIYCFSTDTAWVNYEEIQSDIFDHLYAVANDFGLRIFQHPTGADFTNLKTN